MFFLPAWLLLSLLTGVTSNAFNFLNRFILKDKDDPTAYAWYFELLRFLFFAVYALFDWHLVITSKSIILYILLGITELISVYWYMKMHSYSHLSVSAILSRTRMIWVPILGFFLIHEKLKSLDYLGIAVIFFGISIVSAPKKLFVDKGAFYANASAFMVALNIVITVMLLPYGSNAVILAICGLPPVILFPLLMKNRKQRIKTLFKTNLLIKSLAIGLSIAAILFFMWALRVGEASKVNAIYQGMLILSVLAGIIFLKERDSIGKKVLGSAITVIGVVLLSFS